MSEAKIEITSRHGNVSDKTKAYAEEKIGKLHRLHDRISRVHLVFDSEGERGQRFLELVLHVDNGHTFVAKEHGEHARETIDLLMAKMEAQLRKDKEKLKAHHKPGAKNGIGAPPDPESGQPSYDDVLDATLRPGKKKPG